MQIQDNFETTLREILKAAGFGGLRSVLEHARESAGAAPADASGLLRQLLQSIECNEESVSALRVLLGGQGLAACASMLSEKDMVTADALAQKLRAASPDELRALLQQLEEAAPAASPQQPVSDTLKAALRTLIENREGENPEAGRIAAPFQRLRELLETLPGASSGLQSGSSRVIEEALKGQLDHFRAVQGGLEAIVEDIFSDTPLQTLCRTVDRAIKSLGDPQQGLEVRVLQFLKAFRDDLSAAGSDVTRLKPVLEAALATIKEFGGELIEPLPRQVQVLLKSINAQVETLIKMPAVDVANSKEYASLQALMKELADLDTGWSKDFSAQRIRMEQQVQKVLTQEDPAPALRLLGAMAKESEALLRPAPDLLPIADAVRTTLERLGKDGALQLERLIKDAPEGLRPALQDIARALGKPAPDLIEVRAKLEDLLRAISERGQEPAEEKAAVILRKLDHEIRETLRALDGIERGAERTEPVRLAPPAPEHLEQRAALLKDPAVLLVLRALKGADLSLPGTEAPLEKGFVDFLRKLAARVPGNDAGLQAPLSPRKDLDEALSKLEQQYRSEHPREADTRSLEVRRMADALGQMLKGQELLERLNPLMNLLGEPALLIFPTIIHGFASQIELIAWPKPHAQEEDEDTQEEEGDQEKKGRQERYKCFELDMTFKGMGRVQSRVAFRQGEFLLDLVAETDAVASFLPQRLTRFETLLRSPVFAQGFGFERMQLRASSGQAESRKPEWLPVVSGLFGSTL